MNSCIGLYNYTNSILLSNFVTDDNTTTRKEVDNSRSAEVSSHCLTEEEKFAPPLKPQV